jgi:hypothetical protein
MGVAIWLFTLLVVAPTALQASVGGAPMLGYLFVLNLIAGYLFWTRRGLGELGEKSVALVYLASGVLFFSVLVEPMRIDRTDLADLRSWDAWQSALEREIPEYPRLEGSPVAQGAVARRTGRSSRSWLEGMVEDVVLPPERPR